MMNELLFNSFEMF